MREQILEILADITGLDAADFEANPDLNLLESGILDSLSIVMMVKEVSSITGKEYSLQSFEPEDFTTVESMVTALLR